MDETTRRLVERYGLDKEARRLHNRHCLNLLTLSASESVLKTEQGIKARDLVEKSGGSYYSGWYSDARIQEAKQILRRELGENSGDRVHKQWCEEIEHRLNNIYDI